MRPAGFFGPIGQSVRHGAVRRVSAWPGKAAERMDEGLLFGMICVLPRDTVAGTAFLCCTSSDIASSIGVGGTLSIDWDQLLRV